MVSKEILRNNMKIISLLYKSEFENTIEVNNELKLNVDEQQYAINHLKEQCNIYDEYDTQEITAARTPMKKKRSVCVTFNKKFAMTKLVEKISHTGDTNSLNRCG